MSTNITLTTPVVEANPFSQARAIAQGDCLVHPECKMHWVIEKAVLSLKQDGKAISKANVLEVIGYLETAHG
jgi:hypothetical protein